MPIEDALRRLLREELADVRRALDELRHGRGGQPDELLTVAQVSAAASLSPSTIRAWIRSGRLKATGSGRTLRIRQADLLAAMESAQPREFDAGKRAEAILKR